MDRSIDDMFNLRQRNNNSANKNKTTTLYKNAQTDRFSTDTKKSPIAIVSAMKKIIKSKMNYSFLKLLTHRNEKEVKKIITRYLSVTLKHKMKMFENTGMARIKSYSYRKKTIFNFSKLLNTL